MQKTYAFASMCCLYVSCLQILGAPGEVHRVRFKAKLAPMVAWGSEVTPERRFFGVWGFVLKGVRDKESRWVGHPSNGDGAPHTTKLDDSWHSNIAPYCKNP